MHSPTTPLAFDADHLTRRWQQNHDGDFVTENDMTKEEMAALLTGREYGKEITKEECAQAKASGLVVIFGYSDDNVELRGAIYDEIGAYEGTRLTITSEGALPNWDDIEHSDKDTAREYFRKESLPREVIDCDWAPVDEPTLSWRYSTKMPHATFTVMEDGEVYCRGIVIALADISPIPAAIGTEG